MVGKKMSKAVDPNEKRAVFVDEIRCIGCKVSRQALVVLISPQAAAVGGCMAWLDQVLHAAKSPWLPSHTCLCMVCHTLLFTPPLRPTGHDHPSIPARLKLDG